MSVPIPEYEKYTLFDLYQVLNSIRQDLVPHVYEALIREIDSRTPVSAKELEDCYFALDKERNPEVAARLEEQIDALGGSIYAESEPITEENKYKTFWRRFWANFVDGFIIGIPFAVLMIVLERTGIITSVSKPYYQHFHSLATFAYFIVMHAMFGQTVGKMATGVKVFDKTGELEISWKQSLLRVVVPVLFFVVSLGYFTYTGTSFEQAWDAGSFELFEYAILFLSIAWLAAEVITLLSNSRRRAVHDFIAGTVVIRVS